MTLLLVVAEIECEGRGKLWMQSVLARSNEVESVAFPLPLFFCNNSFGELLAWGPFKRR